MQGEDLPEHRWLQRLVGDWTFEAEMAPGQPEGKHAGTEHVRSLGGVWIACEGELRTPEPGTTLMTLGYDPGRGRFVGSFIGSMMSFLWLYDGTLDEAGRVLTLESEGPSFTTEGEMGRYRDVVTLESDDHRVFTSHYQGDGGEWRPFITYHYRRVR